MEILAVSAIDIGANVGIYSIAIARRVRRVIAYEPGSEARGHLERGRTLNAAGHLEIVAAALSDSVRTGFLSAGSATELNRVAAQGEPIAITALDREDSLRTWSPDFVKVDAEGEDGRVVAGGRRFFARHSPLVMFEISDRSTTPPQPIELYRALGYRFYRSLPSAPLLVPYHDGDNVDWEGNLFAAKEDRARTFGSRSSHR
jgi:FkbM family methyltransferase